MALERTLMGMEQVPCWLCGEMHCNPEGRLEPVSPTNINSVEPVPEPELMYTEAPGPARPTRRSRRR